MSIGEVIQNISSVPTILSYAGDFSDSGQFKGVFDVSK